jgi:hypothetical protein
VISAEALLDLRRVTQRVLRVHRRNPQSSRFRLSDAAFRGLLSPCQVPKALWDSAGQFAFCSPILGSMFGEPPARFCDFAVTCKGCGECVPAPVETMPSSWIIVQCPLCNEKNQYVPPDIYRGNLSMKLTRKLVRSAEVHSWAR